MTVYRDRATGTHRYDFMFRGRRYTKRGFETKTAARDAAVDHRRLLKAGRTDPFQTFQEMVGAFLTSSQRTKSAAWCYQLEIKLNKAFPRLADLHPREIMRGHIEPVLDRLARDGNTARSVNEYRKIAIAVMNYGVGMGALATNPAAGILRAPESEASVEPIPKPHLQRLILAAEPGLRALLVFLSQTGARFIEAARLRSSEVVVAGPRPACLLTTRKNRGGKARKRLQPLTTLAWSAIEPLLGEGDQLVFTGVAGGALEYRTELKKLQRLCDRLGLPRYAFHQVRHWAGMVATQLGKSKKAVAQFLGQTDTGATERYMHAAEPELWEVAQRLEAELGELRESEDMALVAGVKSGVSGVKNGVNLDAVGCNQATANVGKSRSLRTERCPSGRRGTPGERVYPKGTVGSNPTLSALCPTPYAGRRPCDMRVFR
jgi:integrase